MGGQFSPGENFSRIFRVEENSTPLFLVNFDVFLVDFDAKTQTGGKYAQNSKWGRKKEGGTDPWMGEDKFSRNFLRGGKLTCMT